MQGEVGSMVRERAIFISHSYRYDGATAHHLITRLLQRRHFRIRDLSVLVTRRFREQSTEDLKDQIRDLIKQADVLILIMRRALNDNDMVRFELDVARENGVPIIAIPPPKGTRIPAIAHEYANRIVNRNINSIANAILELSPSRNGTKPSLPVPSIERTSLLPSVDFEPTDVSTEASTATDESAVDVVSTNPERRKQGLLARLFGL
jgi:hypothetical protein